MKLSLAVLVCLLASSTAAICQDCSFWDQASTGDSTIKIYQHGDYHISGLHTMNAYHNGSCTYSDPNPGTGSTCIAEIDITNIPSVDDFGWVSSWTHVIRGAQMGNTNANQGPVNTTATSGAVVAACALGQCNLNVSVSNQGVTFTLSGGTEIWSFQDGYTSYCPTAVCSFCKISCTGNETCPGTECCLNNFCAPNQYCGGTARNAPKKLPDFVDFVAMKDRLQ